MINFLLFQIYTPNRLILQSQTRNRLIETDDVLPSDLLAENDGKSNFLLSLFTFVYNFNNTSNFVNIKVINLLLKKKIF